MGTVEIEWTAIRLYESMGFKHLPPNLITPSPYERADV
jgi:hypothetical protein